MKVVTYFCSVAVAIAGIVLVSEYGLQQLLPEDYLGYLVEQDEDHLKWGLGPFEPSQAATGFNAPVTLQKPEDTIRIISLGASATEGWVTAETVFNKYGQKSDTKSLSSYSRSLEFIMNEISHPSSKKIEVINLGVAAYNVTDVIRMLKDSMKLDPDLFLIHITLNETWTSERSKWPAYLNDDVPYYYSEIAHEIFTEKRAAWKTLVPESNAFSPVLLGNARKPIVPEPPGREEGLKQRLANYKSELERLGDFLKRKGMPVLFLIPSQNIADFEPFGSMAKSETNAQQLEKLNALLIEALAEPGPDSKEKYLEILALDDGIAEANFQLGKIYLQENNPELARVHFWRANDRDKFLKRPPSAFHEVTRHFVKENSFPYLDVMNFYQSKSRDGIVGNNFLYDDVHPQRDSQFALGTEISELIINMKLLQTEDYSASLQRLPDFDGYNAWTGFDQESEGKISYLRAAHNYFMFERYLNRMRWDPMPARFLDPIIDYLDVANNYAPSDQSQLLSAGLNTFLGRMDKVENIIAAMDCQTSAERAAQVNSIVTQTSKRMLGKTHPESLEELQQILVSKGCNQ